MTQLLTLARDLVSTINADLPGNVSETRGLPAIMSYQPVIEPDQITLPVLYVAPASLDVVQGDVDTCGIPVGATLSVVYAERLQQAGPRWDSGTLEELDDLLAWIQSLFEFLAGLHVTQFGRAKSIELVAPGATGLYVWPWLKDSSVWCTPIGMTWEP